MKLSRTRTRKRRRGQALVEFALTVSILMMLTLLTIQFGILFNATLVLTHLSREGARNAAVHCLETSNQNTSDAAIRAYVKKMANGTTLHINDSDIGISPAPNNSNRASGKEITVTVTYNLSQKVFVPKLPGVSQLMRNYTATSVQIIE